VENSLNEGQIPEKGKNSFYNWTRFLIIKHQVKEGILLASLVYNTNG
jgi:hypothetical protein